MVNQAVERNYDAASLKCFVPKSPFVNFKRFLSNPFFFCNFSIFISCFIFSDAVVFRCGNEAQQVQWDESQRQSSFDFVAILTRPIWYTVAIYVQQIGLELMFASPCSQNFGHQLKSVVKVNICCSITVSTLTFYSMNFLCC